MDINTAKHTLDEIERKQFAYKYVLATVMNDASTVAPRKAIPQEAPLLGSSLGRHSSSRPRLSLKRPPITFMKTKKKQARNTSAAQNSFVRISAKWRTSR